MVCAAIDYANKTDSSESTHQKAVGISLTSHIPELFVRFGHAKYKHMELAHASYVCMFVYRASYMIIITMPKKFGKELLASLF